MARTPISTIAQYAPCTINIRGKVAYSRVASRIEGTELEAQNRQAAANGRIQHSKPYITITINNPVIVDNGTLPQQVKSVISERFFTRQDGTMAFTQESKSPFLPTILYSNEAGDLKGMGIANNDVPLQAELASGLDVTIGVDLFVMKSAYNNAGLGIKYILINEPIRYFSSNSIENDLAAQGINYTPVQSAPRMTQQVSNFAQTAGPSPNLYTAPTPQVTPVQNVVPQYTQPAYQPMSSQPFMEEDIPFNRGSAPQSLGVEPKCERPVRYY